MYYSNKWQLFCICEQLGGGKTRGMVWKSLLKSVNAHGYDEMQDKIEINLHEIKY